MRNKRQMNPGKVLLEEFLKPMGISQYRLAKSIKLADRVRREVKPYAASESHQRRLIVNVSKP